MSGARDDILERQSLVFIGTKKYIWGLQGKLREHSGFLEDDSDGFGKIPGNQRNLQEGFPKAN